ncbi:uncharacterized protein LOC119287991 isoform X2 [Triticum dicoccoides]|uniref:uncharacterized protein LOC119287991 isoform X2 n=1 Tax=Triticum dicoccoides TaxID=85692 RepID=UPI00188F452F|nr:uncharacterized protein LOC119287991 isoform X2 [Triticum dicoccoides]
MPASQGRNPRRGDALLFGIGCANRHGRHPLWTGMTTMQGRMRTGTLSSTTTGHRTSAQDALRMAPRMGLNLVEVLGKSGPPVSKIIGFHKDKYTKDAMEKDRLKEQGHNVVPRA